MAFAQWQAEQSDENAQALDEAEAARSQADITCQEAKEAYEDKKASSAENAGVFGLQQCRRDDFVTDGASGRWTPELTDQAVCRMLLLQEVICGYFCH
ncbi:MAG: hypothetical protein ACLU2Y_14615 [Blautia massiliensis (ex Durand et al. 2017)]|uniref:hypothetical protein n=1 Tax=Blautia massiliensis (ex Durand et al. 2017) TaxID=1737424 RepID=UPI00399CC806